jgi:hypothetical protein
VLTIDFWQSCRLVVNPLASIWNSASQTLAGEIDTVGVVDEAVEDGVGISRVAEHDITPQYRNDCHS